MGYLTLFKTIYVRNFAFVVLHLNFPLIPPFGAKLTELVQFDKTNDACLCIKLVNVWDTASTEISVAYLVEHQPTPPMFCTVLIIFG